VAVSLSPPLSVYGNLARLVSPTSAMYFGSTRRPVLTNPRDLFAGARKSTGGGGRGRDDRVCSTPPLKAAAVCGCSRCSRPTLGRMMLPPSRRAKPALLGHDRAFLMHRGWCPSPSSIPDHQFGSSSASTTAARGSGGPAGLEMRICRRPATLTMIACLAVLDGPVGRIALRLVD